MGESKTFPADLGELKEVLDFVRRHLSETPLNKREKMRVELALEEAVVNVINHTPQEETFEFTIDIKLEPGRQIEFVLKDPGPAFNPLVHESEDAGHLPIDQIKEGGAGLTLMRGCMDALFYRREEGFNVLTMVKVIN